ncbi:MAG: cytochrome C [Desulfuromonadales bacterium]|nr:cytochrome C [Desulfuromonadales bacterium]
MVFYGGSAWGSNCTAAECHAGLSGQPAKHGPVAAGECTLCHQSDSASSDAHPQTELVTEGGQLCRQCHDPQPPGRYAHAPYDGDSCDSCHDPHGGKPGSVKPVAEICSSCHEEYDQKYLHGPTAAGACTYCHDPHRSDQPALLKTTGRQLCLKCHDEFREGLEKSQFIHTAVKEQQCSTCHDPHESAFPYLLSEKMPDICLTCHEEVGRRIKNANTAHPALQNEEKCGTCHSTHFSDASGMLNSSEKDLCLSCHDKDDHTRSDAIKNIAAALTNQPVLHGPIGENRCASCHNPHGSDHFRMLRGKYPEQFYAPYRQGTYALCFNCHDEKMLAYADTSIYTEFRNGKNNLHYVHVADYRKGRTCRACHEPHAGRQEKLISQDGPEFGDWRIPTRFSITETGGSCMPGCHRQLEYDRKTPVDYKSTLPVQ